MSTPGFRPMWEAARAEAQRRTARRRRYARGAGVAGALLLVATFVAPALRTPEPDLAQIAALSARHRASTTDFLLETPGLARLETTPAFGDPLEEERWAPDAEPEERT